MPTAKTADSSIFVASSTTVLELNDVLNWSVNGVTAISNEAMLGTRDEEASVHSAGVEIEIGTLYEGTQTQSLRALAGQPRQIVIRSEAGWESYPVDMPDLGQEAGANAPITAELSVPQRARGRYGSSSVPVALEMGSASVGVNLTGQSVVQVLITSIGSTTATNCRFSNSSNHQNVAYRVGLQRITIPSNVQASGATFNINSASNVSVTGFILLGSDQPLATG